MHGEATRSVCPICLKQIAAQRVSENGDVYLRKTCPDHGDFSAIVWRGGLGPEFDNWNTYKPAKSTAPSPDCPTDCGLCDAHLNRTCCALVEITSRCNLRCPICFAEADGGNPDPTVDELFAIFKVLAEAGNTFVQLSGGEPTVRDDLPEIIAAARRAGCETVQLNSNGLRLAREPNFTKSLANAGLSFVFMQFDGVCDDVYKTLRGAPILDEKLRAIEVCGENNLGVTLVPTVVPGVNDAELGAIIELAVANSPTVRGVHFQPVSYFGRYPSPPRDDDRITLPEILRAIEAQTDGKFKLRDFNPSSCDHPRCGFHGDFVVLPQGKIMKLTKKYNPDACCADDAHLKNRAFVARRWERPTAMPLVPENAAHSLATQGVEAEPLVPENAAHSLTTQGVEAMPLGSENAAHMLVARAGARTVKLRVRTAERAAEKPLQEPDYRDMTTFLDRVKTHGFTISAMAFQDAWTLDIERLRRCSLHVFDGGRTVPFCAQYMTGAL